VQKKLSHLIVNIIGVESCSSPKLLGDFLKWRQENVVKLEIETLRHEG